MRGQALGRRRRGARSRPGRPRLRPETLIVLTIAGLFGLGVLTGGDDGEETAEAPAAAAAKVERVARKLERVRELEFERIPEVRTVTAAEAREEGLAILDEDYPPERREADETVLKLLGLIPDDTDLRELLGTIFGEEVAGYYDQRTKEMTLVGDGELDEITLAHELTHALEDQHFGLGDAEAELDDEATARVALVEGTATVAMLDYLNPRGDRTRLLASLDLAEFVTPQTDLPPYVMRALLFPYAAGARFVDAIGTWGPANRALAGDPPASTEQVLHPAKYRAGEEPLAVPVAPPGGAGWESAASGTIGEFDTAELVRSSDSPARAQRAGAGWGGGSYELWERGEEDALALAWRWDTPRDAAEFAAALPRYIEQTLHGRQVEPGVWRTPERNDVTVETGRVIRLVIAPR